jgi:RNA polymerase sigma-70 factor (ECF subfamily)
VISSRSTPRGLYVYACRHADPQDADDLVAEAFATLVRRIDDIPAGEEMPWLVGCVRKLAANHHRRSRTRRDHWRDVVRDAWHLDTDLSPETAVAARESALGALGSLSETDREALLLVAWEGLTIEQAAGVQGVSANAYGVRLHRARRRLESAWQPDDLGPGALSAEGVS